MKKLLLYITFSILSYTASAQVPIAGYIKTIGDNDTYPTHIDTLGYGGFRVVANLSSRDNISQLRRKVGMWVKVQSEDNFYSLVGGISNSNWVLVAPGNISNALDLKFDKTGGDITNNVRMVTNGTNSKCIYWQAGTDFRKEYFYSTGDINGSSQAISYVGDNITGDGRKEGWVWRKTGGGDVPTPTPDVDVMRMNMDTLTWMGNQVHTYATAYTKQVVDSLINASSTQTYYILATSGNTISNAVLQNANILLVSRAGLIYYPTANPNPTGNFFYNSNSAGSIKFQDNFASGGEPVLVQYKIVNSTIGGIKAPILSYSSFSQVTFPLGPALVYITSDETKGDVPYLYFAPSGTNNSTQLQAIASTLNTF